MWHRGRLLVVLIMFLLNTSVVFSATKSRVGSVDDWLMTTRLRYQIQHVAKLSLQIELGHQPMLAQRQRQLASKEIQDVLSYFAGRGASVEEGRLASRLQNLMLTDLTAKANAWQGLNEVADVATQLASKLNLLLFNQVDQADVRLVDLASRQAMLAQRLARLYLLRVKSPLAAGHLVDIEQTRREFDAGLRELSVLTASRTESKDAFLLIDQQWIFLNEALLQLQRQPASTVYAAHVVTSSERIVEMIDNLLGIYFSADKKIR